MLAGEGRGPEEAHELPEASQPTLTADGGPGPRWGLKVPSPTPRRGQSQHQCKPCLTGAKTETREQQPSVPSVCARRAGEGGKTQSPLLAGTGLSTSQSDSGPLRGCSGRPLLPLLAPRKMSFHWQEEEINVLPFGLQECDPGLGLLQPARGWGRG